MTNFSSHPVDFQIPEELNYCSEIGLCFLWVYLFFFWDNESFMDGKRARSDIMRKNTKTVK